MFLCKDCGFTSQTKSGLGLHMRNTHNIKQKVFWLKLPDEELAEWQTKAKTAGYNSLTDYIKFLMNNDTRIEQAKLLVKQDYDFKIEELKKQNEKFKLQADTLILVLNRYQKLTPDIKIEIEKINEKIMESGYTPEQWKNMIEEETLKQNENMVLNKEWNKLTAEQKQKARWYMSCRKCSLPEAINSVTKKLSADFKETFS